jgi:MFS transporter, ACS family, D-galactonate transporter
VTFGYLLSAYGWTYAALQLPSGVLLDRFGVRKIGCSSTFLWSVASFCAAAASSVGSFFVARLLLGIGEAPTFPANSKAVGYWFPARERSLATACFDSAAKLRPAIGVPLVGLLLLHFGWRWSFAATGFISIFYFALFYWLYRNPTEDTKLSEAERQFIVRGDAQPKGFGKTGTGTSVAYLLSQRKVVGLVLGSAAITRSKRNVGKAQCH